MAKVELQQALNEPVGPAREAAEGILEAIAANRDTWAEFALYLELKDAGLPDVGYIAIPINLTLGERETEPRHRIGFRIEAKRSPQAFPVFEGSMGVDANGPSSSAIWVAGTYELPAHGLGSLVNATLGRNAAEKTLQNFLGDLARGITARVERKELASARYRVMFNRG